MDQNGLTIENIGTGMGTGTREWARALGMDTGTDMVRTPRARLTIENIGGINTGTDMARTPRARLTIDNIEGH